MIFTAPLGVREAAIAALANRLCPIPPTEDGVKKPGARPDGKWKEWQGRRSTVDEVHLWYGTKGKPKRSGLGIVCGMVSGNLEVFEFDCKGAAASVYEDFKAAAVALGLGDLVERIEAGYLERTPSGGIHWLYRCEVICGSSELACYLDESDLNPNGKPKTKVLIETRGEGGFVVTAPSNGSVHPSGKPYELLRGGFDTIATITPEEREALWNLARTFDRMPEPETGPLTVPDVPPKGRASDWDDLVQTWDDFIARTSWADVLPAGWVQVYSHGSTCYWRRPGKDRGVSATTGRNGADRLYVFSSSTEFATLKPYSRFDAYALLHHGGDGKAAATELCKQGYGQFKTWTEINGKSVLQTRQNPCPKGTRIAKPGDGPPVEIEGKHGPLSNGKPHEAENNGFHMMPDADLGLTRADTVEPEAIDWEWENHFAIGKLNLVASDGGEGKSQIALGAVAAVTVGGRFFDGSGPVTPGRCFILAAEDGAKDTIKPRLIALGADMTRVHFLKPSFKIKGKPGAPDTIHPQSFQDLVYWRAVLTRYPDLRLIVADPLPAYLGRGVNDHRNNDVRAVLEPFVDLLDELRIGMIGITHLNKSTDMKTPVHKILGSVAYANLARTVHVISRDPDDRERRFLFMPKNNLVDPSDAPALAFRIVGHTFDYKGKEIKTSRVEFESEPLDPETTVGLTTGKAAQKRGPSPEKTMAVATWLADFLQARMPNPVPLAAIFDAAGQEGLIGTKRDDGKWSNVGILYQARDRVVALEGDRAGVMIQDMKAPIRVGSRPIVHWYLSAPDAPF
jgi:AAA domain-containing protein/bifunctional DNA primase/polymerase-like protein